MPRLAAPVLLLNMVVMMCTIGIAGIIAVLVYAMARPIKRLSGAMSQVQEGILPCVCRKGERMRSVTDGFL